MDTSRITELRKQNNLTYKQMSDILGISAQSYSRYERGLRDFSIEQLIGIADYFNTSVDYLIGKTDTKKPHKLNKKS